MTHRGACSADNDSGDGAGALIGVPHSFYQHKLREEFSLELPESGKYGTGLIFMDPETTEQTKQVYKLISTENIDLHSSGQSLKVWPRLLD